MRRKHEPDEHTLTPPPLHGDKFLLWHDLLPEMQGCVAEFLDNGTRQTLGQTCKQAYARWHVDTSSGVEAVVKLLAKDAPVDYIRPFITRVRRTMPDEIAKVRVLMATKLVKWNRWYANDIVKFMLDEEPRPPLSTESKLSMSAFVAAIRYSNTACADWIFGQGRITDAIINGGVSNVPYRACGAYGNIQALQQLISSAERLRFSHVGIEPFDFFQIIAANLQSKPRYAFDWPTFFATIPVRYHVPTEALDWALVLSRILKLAEDFEVISLVHISNCYVFWQHLGPIPQAHLRQIWALSAMNIPFVKSIGHFFDDKETKNLKEHYAKIDTYLTMAEEMGFAAPFRSRYENNRAISCSLELIKETRVESNTETLCQWFIKRGGFDVPDLAEDALAKIRCFFFISLTRHTLDNVRYIRDWFAAHTFKGALQIVDIINDFIALYS